LFLLSAGRKNWTAINRIPNANSIFFARLTAILFLL
jgi:hypothetical protein